MKPTNCYRFRGTLRDCEAQDRVRVLFYWHRIKSCDFEELVIFSTNGNHAGSIPINLPPMREILDESWIWIPFNLALYVFMGILIKRRRWIYRPYPAEGPW